MGSPAQVLSAATAGPRRGRRLHPHQDGAGAVHRDLHGLHPADHVPVRAGAQDRGPPSMTASSRPRSTRPSPPRTSAASASSSLSLLTTTVWLLMASIYFSPPSGGPCTGVTRRPAPTTTSSRVWRGP